MRYTPPSPDRIVLGDVLRRHVRERADATFAVYPGLATWTYGQTLEAAEAAAAGLARLGVAAGDRVLCWLPNGPEFIQAWFGAALLGAVHTPCNLAWRGRMLEHALSLADARVAVVHADLLPLMAGLDLAGLQDIIVVGEAPAVDLPARLHTAGGVFRPGVAPAAVELQASDPMHLLFTSGTTGASKAVLCSYGHMAAFILEAVSDSFGPDARFLNVLPLSHAGGLSSIYAQVLAGGSIVLPARFRTEEFWPTVRDCGVTTTTLQGVMVPFLLEAPPSADDKAHGLEVATLAPYGAEAAAFVERFGVRAWTSYGSTEMGVVLACPPDSLVIGGTGLALPGIEYRIVDADDYDVPDGAIGELVIRRAQPWSMMLGYFRNDAATAAAFRNGWYHTGDFMRRTADGMFQFKDRKKDAIRRRGENISSQEVEADVLRHPLVREVAAYGVVTDRPEDEVMVCVVLAADAAPDWPDVVSFLGASMAHYMVPRYYRRVADLPRTESGKVRKDQLRDEGVTPDTWDREAHGLKLRGVRVGERA